MWFSMGSDVLYPVRWWWWWWWWWGGTLSLDHWDIENTETFVNLPPPFGGMSKAAVGARNLSTVSQWEFARCKDLLLLLKELLLT